MTTQEMSSEPRTDSVKRWRDMLASERDAAALYTRLAEAETGEREQIFRELAAIELKHAAHWEGKLRDAGAAVPGASAAAAKAAATKISMTFFGRVAIGTIQSKLSREIRIKNFGNIHSARSWLKSFSPGASAC